MSTSADEGWGLFRQMLALRVLGRVPYEAMPAAAVDALVAGCDSPSLGELAGMESQTWSQIRPVVQTVQHEIDADFTDHEARVLLADTYLAEVASGALDPALFGNYWWAELLSDLDGVYGWFASAIYELDLLVSVDPAGVAAAIAEVRRRAAWAVAQTPEARQATTDPPGDNGPFIRWN